MQSVIDLDRQGLLSACALNESGQRHRNYSADATVHVYDNVFIRSIRIGAKLGMFAGLSVAAFSGQQIYSHYNDLYETSDILIDAAKNSGLSQLDHDIGPDGLNMLVAVALSESEDNPVRNFIDETEIVAKKTEESANNMGRSFVNTLEGTAGFLLFGISAWISRKKKHKAELLNFNGYNEFKPGRNNPFRRLHVSRLGPEDSSEVLEIRDKKLAKYGKNILRTCFKAASVPLITLAVTSPLAESSAEAVDKKTAEITPELLNYDLFGIGNSVRNNMQESIVGDVSHRLIDELPNIALILDYDARSLEEYIHRQISESDGNIARIGVIDLPPEFIDTIQNTDRNLRSSVNEFNSTSNSNRLKKWFSNTVLPIVELGAGLTLLRLSKRSRFGSKALVSKAFYKKYLGKQV